MTQNPIVLPQVRFFGIIFPILTDFLRFFYDKIPIKLNKYFSDRCGGSDETTPTLVGGVEPVEVLLEKGPSLGFVPDLPAERQFPVVASIGDKVFLCGGADSLLAAKSTCFYYSFVKGRWIEMEEMPKGALSRSAGVAAYGDFYIMGGQTPEGNATQSVSLNKFKIRSATLCNYVKLDRNKICTLF